MPQAGKPNWAMAAPVRYLSYSIDTVLLTLALMLLTMLPPAVFGLMLSIARSHHPLGILVGWLA